MVNKVDSLRLKFEATTDQLRAELRRADDSIRRSTQSWQTSFAKFDGMVMSAARGLGIFAGALSVAGIGRFVSGTLDSADALAKLSRQIGINAEALQEFDFAASQNGVTSDKLNSSLERLTKRIGEARAGTGEFAKVSSELGVNLSSTEDVFLQVADAVANAADEQDAARIATAAFGREGLSLVRMLQGGRAGLKAYADEANRLGIVLSGDNLAKAEKINDEFDKLNRVIRTNLQEGLLSGLSSDAGMFSDVVTNPAFAQSLRNIGQAMGDAFAWLVENRDGIRESMQVITGAWIGSKFGGIPGAIYGGIAGSRIDDLSLGGVSDELPTWFKDLEGAANDASVALDENGNILIRVSESAGELSESLGGGGGGSSKGVNGSLDKMRQSLAKLEAELYPAEAATQAYRDQIQLLDDAMFAGLLTMEEHEAMVMRLAEGTAEAAESIDKTASTLSTALDESVRRLDTAFVDMWDNMLSGAKSSFDALKNLLRQTLAEMAHAAITRPIMLSIGGALGFGSSTASAAGSSLLGGGGIDLLSMGTSLASGAAFAGIGTGAGLAAANIGAAGYFGGFGANMALAGSSLSSGAIGTAIGAAAPYLLPVLGIAALASMWGKDKTDPRVGFGDRSFVGDGAFEDGVFRTGPFSRIGYRGASHGMDAGSEQWTALLDTVVAFDQALASYASGEEIARIQSFLQNAPGRNGGEAYGHGLDTSLVELDDLTDQALGALVAERMRYITAEMSSLVGRSMDRFLQDFGGTIEELGTMLAALGRLDEQINTDVFERYTTDLEQANRSIVETFRDQAYAVRDLSFAYDGTVESTQALADAHGTLQQMAYQLFAAIDQASAAVDATLGSTIERITLDLLDQEGQYERLRGQAESLADSLNAMLDPAQIAATVAEIDRLTNQAYGLLGEEQRGVMGQEFIGFLQDTQALADARLEESRQATIDMTTTMRDVVESALTAAALGFSQAATQMQNAAQRMEAAASRPLTVRVEMPSYAEVNA